jgi:hypothetical protein
VRDFPGRHCIDFAETNLSPHRASRSKPARLTAPVAATEIVVNNFDLVPTKLMKLIPHGVLEEPAFLVAHDLMGRRLPFVQNCLLDLVNIGALACEFVVYPFQRSCAQQMRHQLFHFPANLGGKLLPVWCRKVWSKQVELRGIIEAVQASHRQIIPFSDPDWHDPRAAIRLRGMLRARTSIPGFRTRASTCPIRTPCASFVDRLMNENSQAKPGMPAVKNFPFLGLVGAMLSSCTIQYRAPTSGAWR